MNIDDYTDDDMIGLTQVATSDQKFGRGVTIPKDEILLIFYKKVIIKWEVTKRIQDDVLDSHPCCITRARNRHRLLFLGNVKFDPTLQGLNLRDSSSTLEECEFYFTMLKDIA